MNGHWRIPQKENPDFIAHMEYILDIHKKPYDAEPPVILMDEKPYQILGTSGAAPDAS